MPRFQNLTDLIDQKCFDGQGTPKHPGGKNRRHLGASIIGRACKREIWYGFRWAMAKSGFPGRVLRLFDRGHEEEFRFIDWLKMVGAEVEDVDPETVQTLWYHPESEDYIKIVGAVPDDTAQQCENVTGHAIHEAAALVRGIKIESAKQFSFRAVMGHFAGSLDGKAWNVPDLEQWGILPNQKILVEFKTHGDTSFKKLVADNDVRKTKPEHYAQMVIYMEEHKLPAALYCAVNKNDDDLYFEVIMRDPEHAADMTEKAREIIHSRKPPARISNSPSWFGCKFCDHRRRCHFGEPLAKNCRTCVFSLPVEDGRWFCEKWNKTIPQDFEPTGCDEWKQIQD